MLEGNRRTAALKHLLADGARLRADVKNSIQCVAVKRFLYQQNPHFDEARVIEVLLGSIHIDGPREWGALERANFVYRSYLREFGGRSGFSFDVRVARRVGGIFRMGPKMVHKCLTVSRVYEQLRNADYPAEPKHFTLLDLATKTRAVAGDYFGLDADRCCFSEAGLDRFANLCLGRTPPIHNPKLFAAFVTVYAHGTELELSQVEDGDRDVEDVCESIEARRARRAFREEQGRRR